MERASAGNPDAASGVAIATSSRLAAEAAYETAARGGNAVDCAIAASLLTMNTEPGVCALAGGAYVTVWAADGSPVTVDGNVAIPGLGRRPADPQPSAVPVHMEYGGGIDTLVGCGSVAVPGAVAALETASREFGTLPWRELFVPTVRAVREGFPLPRACHYYLRFSGKPVFGRSRDGYRALHDERDALRGAGERITIPHLADTLEEIAHDGGRTFYEGDIADTVIRHVREGGGGLTREDLQRYRAVVRPSLVQELAGWRIAVNPPPAVGGAVLAAMLVAFGERTIGEWNAEALQALLHVQRGVLGFRRANLDLSDDVARDVASLLRLAADGRLPQSGVSASTVHTSAVDGRGLGCAITASSGYGSGEMPDGTGLWLNNCLGELELNRRGLSAGPAGARLPSNMTPAVARSGDKVLAVGSPGADRITTAIHQFLVNFIQRGLPLTDAVAHPRLHLEFAAEGMQVALEPGLEPGDCGLAVNRYPELSMYFGGVGAALFDGERGFTVAADPRREGGACRFPGSRAE